MNHRLRSITIGCWMALLLFGALATPNPRAFAGAPDQQWAQTFVGEYPLQDFTLELKADGTIVLTQAPQTIGGKSNAWRGAWQLDGTTAIIRIVETSEGARLTQPAEMRFTFVDGFATIIGGALPGITTNPDALTFTLGAGQRHPLVRLVNRLLAQYDYLN